MQSENLLNINLAQAAQAASSLHIELTDRFFADLEQEEIGGGVVHAEILVKASACSLFNVYVKVQGHVTVACDRCLDPLTLEVQAEDVVRVKDADPDDADDPELHYLKANDPCYDLSWDLYEIIETALPLQRVHPEDECNQDMTGYILASSEDLDADEEEDA